MRQEEISKLSSVYTDLGVNLQDLYNVIEWSHITICEDDYTELQLSIRGLVEANENIKQRIEYINKILNDNWSY